MEENQNKQGYGEYVLDITEEIQAILTKVHKEVDGDLDTTIDMVVDEKTVAGKAATRIKVVLTVLPVSKNETVL